MMGLLLFLLLLILPIVPLRMIAVMKRGMISVRLCWGLIPILRLRLILRVRAGIPTVYREERKMCRRIAWKRGEVRRKSAWRDAFFAALRGEKLHINMMIGAEDAAGTAYAVGLLRTLADICGGIFRDADIQLAPCFAHPAFSAEGQCIISVIPANIIREFILRKGGKNNASD